VLGDLFLGAVTLQGIFFSKERRFKESFFQGWGGEMRKKNALRNLWASPK
jgi:hypothetical protein